MASLNAILTVEHRENAIVAHVCCAELDHDTTLRFKAELKSIVASGGTSPIIVDLEIVEFLPSIALGALVVIHLALKRNGRKFALAGVRPAIKDIMLLCGLDNLLQIYQQTDAALAQV